MAEPGFYHCAVCGDADRNNDKVYSHKCKYCNLELCSDCFTTTPPRWHLLDFLLNNEEESENVRKLVKRFLKDKKHLKRCGYDAKADPLNMRGLFEEGDYSISEANEIGTLLFGVTEDGYTDRYKYEYAPCPVCIKNEVTKSDVLEYLLEERGVTLEEVKKEMLKLNRK
jgi:hypothetical protein